MSDEEVPEKKRYQLEWVRTLAAPIAAIASLVTMILTIIREF